MFLKELKQDIDAVRERDPAARSSLETLLVSSGLHEKIKENATRLWGKMLQWDAALKF